MARQKTGRRVPRHRAKGVMLTIAFSILPQSRRVLAWQLQQWRSSRPLASYPTHHHSYQQRKRSLSFLPAYVETHPEAASVNTNNNKFEVTAPFPPMGDQPQAIERLLRQVQRGDKYNILRGITGTGKTLVMAHTIARLGRPTLVLCHNKTLAAQLARELRSCLSKNHVQLFVSYYNHYVPESYNEASGKYIAKKSSINDELDALRHLATKALVQHTDVVVVASVSCIYGLGMPKSYLDASVHWQVGDCLAETPRGIAEVLESLLYAPCSGEEEEQAEVFRNTDLSRGQYELSQSVSGATLVLWPPSESFPMRVDLDFNVSDGASTKEGKFIVSAISLGKNSGMMPTDSVTIFPAKHHITEDDEQFEEALRRVQDELSERVKELRTEAKHVEADRLMQRVSQDLVLLRETRTCPGVENYSRHMALRDAGEAPDTLLDYFGFANKTRSDDWLLLVDESHVTLPQLKAMYGGDQARKRKLVKHGYRLPSALDNRPLREEEFWDRIPQSIFVSATPAKRELDLVSDIRDNEPIDMLIRPTYVCDPEIDIRPIKNQLEDLLHEVVKRAERQERVLAIALSKRDAEDMADYLLGRGVAATFIHSGLNIHERSNALKALQSGEVDCLVGVNLLREGLDLPEVSLVAILNADSEGFLRSETALLQTIGRAARNKNGMAIFYANRVTDAMKQCMDATKYRREVQLTYNARYQKEMKSTTGSSTLSIFDLLKDQIQEEHPIEIVNDRGLTQSNQVKTALDVSSRAEAQYSVSVSQNGTLETDHIPSKPGVYFWKDESGEILYIGKAKRLRSRVKSYLSPSAKHTSRIRVMLEKARRVEFILTPSDRDALALESNLIKHHQPLYNVLLKDDESYPYICASVGDVLPQFMIVPRRLEGPKASKYRYFGPYQHFSEINSILEGIEETYGLRSLSFQARYGEVDKLEYRTQFERALSEVFESSKLRKNGTSLRALRDSYEEASILFESSSNQCRDVVAVAAEEKKSTSVVVLVVQLREGMIAGQFSYSCELGPGVETKEDYSDAIKAVLEDKHYPSGEKPSNGKFSFFPDEILVQYPIAETKELKETIRSARNYVEPHRKRSKLNIRSPASRGVRKESDARAIQLAIDNAEQIARQKSYQHVPGAVRSSLDGTATSELASLLDLEGTPERIECYDISHTQGEAAVGSRVVFIYGKPAPELYRRFNIKSVQGVDDYASVEEVLARRFSRAWVKGKGGLVGKDDPWSIPDLVVIDGGKGQLTAAIKGMAKANVYPRNIGIGNNGDDMEGSVAQVEHSPPTGTRSTTVPIVALAKDQEQVFVYKNPDPVNRSSDSLALLLLRALRDESHRFALSSHRKRRSKLHLT